jgi:hypothetical protein
VSFFIARRRHRTRPFLAAAAFIAFCVGGLWSGQAAAYRPFDGTDAAVADPNEVEVEFQPLGTLNENTDKSLVAPATVVNIGLQNRWEAVFEGKGIVPISPSGPFEVVDPAISLKHVLVPGSLQDQTGPSIATEFGMLLPELNGDNHVGASLASIVSQRWDWGTIHFNLAASLTRHNTAETFTGIIIEGPSKWTVRPVAEVFYEQEINQTTTISGLLGLIWQVRDNLSFDVAFRHAFTNGRPVDEIRLGTTFGLPPWSR